MSLSDISVELVIPSYNRLDTLKRTVDRVRLLYPNLRICLGLQGEMPDETWLAMIVKNDRLLRVERLSVPSTTATLNHCFSSSSAEIILLLDDDAEPHFGWVEAHVDAFAADPRLAYTAGREIRATKEQPVISVFVRIIVESVAGLFIGSNKKLNGRIVGWINRVGIMFGNYDQPGICQINSPRGCNMAVRREAFMALGGFNKSFRGNAWGFEADFSLRASKQGYYGEYRGDAIVVHYEVPSGGARALQKTQWFKDFMHNQTLVIRNIGPQAWLGALFRIVKQLARLFRNR